VAAPQRAAAHRVHHDQPESHPPAHALCHAADERRAGLPCAARQRRRVRGAPPFAGRRDLRGGDVVCWAAARTAHGFGQPVFLWQQPVRALRRPASGGGVEGQQRCDGHQSHRRRFPRRQLAGSASRAGSTGARGGAQPAGAHRQAEGSAGKVGRQNARCGEAGVGEGAEGRRGPCREDGRKERRCAAAYCCACCCGNTTPTAAAKAAAAGAGQHTEAAECSTECHCAARGSASGYCRAGSAKGDSAGHRRCAARSAAGATATGRIVRACRREARRACWRTHRPQAFSPRPRSRS